jgi:hypothetical protein
MSNPIDKISEIAGAAANPLSAAESSLKAARGVVNEGYGLVEDVRAIAEKEAARREKKEEQKAPSKVHQKVVKKVARRDVSEAADKYNAAVASKQSMMRQVLIREKQEAEERAMYNAMTLEQKRAYDAAKKEQLEAIKAEKIALAKAEYARKQRNETILGIVLGAIIIVTGSYGLVIWLASVTNHPILRALPGAGIFK